MVYEPLHHKYRPQIFADLVGQEAIATTLTNAIRQQRIAPAYLFTGPRGTGKTSSARILAKSLNCLSQANPTETPCGHCEACKSIALGSALDVIEIDAASNTGVDNIRDLIEKAQFAPVQCRYKVYVIDECITGDALIQTETGTVPIGNPELLGQRVLSYNEHTQNWEYKTVTRWLDRGERSVLRIQTNKRELRCTKNHLIQTVRGWIKAQDIQEGDQILAPQISLTYKLRFVPVDVEKHSQFLHSYNDRGEEAKVFKVTGNAIPILKSMVCGISALKTFWINKNPLLQNKWVYSTAPSWGMVQSPIPTPIAVSPVWSGLTALVSKHGWNIKHNALHLWKSKSVSAKMLGMEHYQPVGEAFAMLSWWRYLKQSMGLQSGNKFPILGWNKFLKKVWRGGIWMMDLWHSLLPVAPEFKFIPKVTQQPKMKFWPNGSPAKAIPQKLRYYDDPIPNVAIPTFPWAQTVAASSSKTFPLTQFPVWNTSLETVRSVRPDGQEQVYDLEVEDNHNFVANGLSVHNCHMLSTAAFNALLKTLEEPPDRVVFVLATTDPQRVLPTIISRCQRFDFRRIPLESMIRHLSTIAAKETIDIVNPAITLVAQLAQGGLRDAESLLDQLSLLPPPVTPEAVWDLVGAVPERDLLALVQAIVADNPEAVLDRTRELMNRGREPLIVLQNLASFYRDLLIAKTAPQRGDMVAVTAETWQEMVILAKTFPIAALLQGQQNLRSSESQLKNTTQPRLWLEVTLMGLLPSALVPIAPSASSSTLSSGSSPAIQQAITTFPQATPAPLAAPVTSTAASPVDNTELGLSSPVNTPTTPTSSPAPTHPSTTATPEPPVSPAEQDCASLWERTLARTRTASAKGLFSQQAQLIAFRGTQAIVAVRPKLLKLAETKVAPIQEAMSQVMGYPVSIKLEPKETIAPSPDPQPQVMPAAPDFPESPRPQTANLSADPQSITHPTPAPQAPVQSLEENQTSPPPPKNNSSNDRPALADPPATPQPYALDVPATPMTQVWNEDEALRAAKSLAQFFNGEVVVDPETTAELDIPALPDEDVPF